MRHMGTRGFNPVVFLLGNVMVVFVLLMLVIASQGVLILQNVNLSDPIVLFVIAMCEVVFLIAS